MIPADIDNAQFKTTRVKEGYDQDEVDDFLDRVIVAWRADRMALEDARREAATAQQLRQQLAALRDRMDETQPIPRPAESSSSSAAKILEFAQKTADSAIEDARKQAETIVNAAHGKANQLVGEATVRRNEIESEIDGLDHMRSELRQKMREFLSSTLERLEEH